MSEFLKDLVKRLRADGQGTLSKGETMKLLEELEFAAQQIVKLSARESELREADKKILNLETEKVLLTNRLQTEGVRIFDGYFQAALSGVVSDTCDPAMASAFAHRIATECILRRLP